MSLNTYNVYSIIWYVIYHKTFLDVDPRLKKICNTIDHLKKDFRRLSFKLYLTSLVLTNHTIIVAMWIVDICKETALPIIQLHPPRGQLEYKFSRKFYFLAKQSYQNAIIGSKAVLI